MKDRDPGFFYGLNASDFVKIGLAFLLTLAGFYLIWRMLFGPSLFEPAAIQAELKSLAPKQQPIHPVEQQDRNFPGEVPVGIAPTSPPPKK